ncbi:hypothetical protein [Conexibacter sp. SYSU D00693]|uniref:hypothetical protein n=1 Tax=Conexibacter sp. SYSU D00693 TaxID=2812560 RepID=UPI00196B0123|nr:hypothetical protein [Conexibacter sp. SYSU D00693]
MFGLAVVVATVLGVLSAAFAQGPADDVYPGGTTTITNTVTTTVTNTVTNGLTQNQQVAGQQTTSTAPSRNDDGDIAPDSDEGDDDGIGPDEGGIAGDQESGGANPASPIVVNTRPGAAGGAPGCRTYAIIHLGGGEPRIDEEVEEALGEPIYVAAINEPIDVEGLAAAAKGTRFADLKASDTALLKALAKELGGQAVTPGALIRAERDTLFDEFEGELGLPSMIVFTHDEDAETDLSDDEDRLRDRFVRSFVVGVRDELVPAVDGTERKVPTAGVELSTTEPTWLPYFTKLNIATVDDIDKREGKFSLYAVHNGAVVADYGRKDTADQPTPTRSTVAPVRCRTAGVATNPASADSGMGPGTGLILALLALTAGWALGLAGRRRVRARIARARG